eukprot:15478897-Alexandrium_andersonii.AAC.1
MMTVGPSANLRRARRLAVLAVGTASGWGATGARPGCGGGSGPRWVAGSPGCPRQVRWHLPAWALR